MVQSIVVGILLCLVQFLAALPWLAALDSRLFRQVAQRAASWLAALIAVVGLGAALGVFIDVVQDPGRLLIWGRVFGAVLAVQLTLDFFAVVFPLLLLIWPQGGAVALAAFREGVRQPLFWVIVIGAVILMTCSPFIPYFTFGEDFKMVRELGFDTIMLAAVVFAVVAASMSISEEIEGRTAITVMSKPVSRRHFLLGKFAGILMASMLMTGLLACFFQAMMWVKLWFDAEPAPDPAWLEHARTSLTPLTGIAADFIVGAAAWLEQGLAIVQGSVFGLCQVTVLLAIAVALATRLPMVVNLVTCLLVFFLGHLTHVLVVVSSGRNTLVNFIARFFDNVLPGLEYFDYGPVVIRDVALDPGRFSLYLGSIVAYAVLYSVIALLFGLILFEDRDLA
ncbi:MAG TPA: ABC transporter permease [Gemmataceae bacterium]|nr:ABC transporter permease [Gemmataceae bacterium]